MQSVLTFNECERLVQVSIKQSDVGTVVMESGESTPQLSISDSNESYTLYKRRWLVLLSYCLLSLSAGSSWLCFPAVSNILRKYYNIQLLSVNMLSIIFGIAIVVFSLPFAVIMDKFGMSITLKLAGFANILGAVIRYFGSNPQFGYWFLLFGNMMTAISVAGFLFLPGKIAVSWFGEKEMGRATAICIAFDALGTGIGFLHATSMITNSEDISVVRHGIEKFLLSQLIPAILIFIIILLCVRKQPKSPPNLTETQLLRNAQEYKDHKSSMKESKNTITISSQHVTLKRAIFKLLKNCDFHLIVHMQGITASIEGIFEILLNEMLIDIYPGREASIGALGFIAVMSGFASNILVGMVIDKTGLCKKVSFIIFSITTISCCLWYILMAYVINFIAKSIVFCILMSTSTSYYTVAFAHSAQVTAPISPSATGVMLVLSSQIYDTFISFVGTEILDVFGSTGVNSFAIFISLIALMLSLFIKNDKDALDNQV